MAAPKLTNRDYKSGGRVSAFPANRLRDFGAGLAVGLVITGFVYLSDHRQAAPTAEEKPEPRAKSKPATQGNDADAEEPTAQYDFYNMLPKFEVVIPEKERGVSGALPAAPVERPGVYVLQAGSYRNQSDAERVRSQLGKQGITASVQRVAVDADVWHRVRVGPLHDLKQVNAIRKSLLAADIDAIVIRVGD
jgi:cell division protein FtsN